MAGLYGLQHISWEYKNGIYQLCGYEPLPVPLQAHQSQAMFRLVAGGNRAGKTYFAIHEVLPYLTIPNTKGWVVAKNYSLCEPLLDGVVSALVALGYENIGSSRDYRIGTFTYNRRMHSLRTWTGATLEGRSADNPDSLHAFGLDYVVIEEAAVFPYYLILTRLIPRLVDSGGWILAIGTFEEVEGSWYRDWWEYGQAYPNSRDVQSFSHPTTDNPYVDQAWLEKQKEILGDDLFAMRFLAVPRPSQWRVFRDFSTLEHVDADICTFDRSKPVYLGIDPGAASTYAVVAVQFKQVEGRLACVVIDEVFYHGTTSTEQMIARCRKRPWWKNVGRDDVPGAIDISAKEQKLIWQNKNSQWMAGLLARKVPVMAGNQTLTEWIVQKRLYVSPHCTDLITEFMQYEYRRRHVGDIHAAKPKDEFNHGIKALIYLIVGLHGFFRRSRPPVRARKRPFMGGVGPRRPPQRW